MPETCRNARASACSLVIALFLLGASSPAARAADCPAAFQAKWGDTGTGPGKFQRPRAIVTDGSFLYVVDGLNNRVQVLTTAGVYVSQWGSAGSGPGQFNNPNGIARDAAGNIYVADTGNSRIQKFSSGGTYLATFGSHGSAAGQVLNPTGVAVDYQGYVYVADTGNYRIDRFASDGSFDRYFGPGPASLPRLSSIVVTNSGIVIVNDIRWGRYYRYTLEGTSLGDWSGPGVYNVIGQIAADAQNRIHAPIIDEAGLNIYEIDGLFRVRYAHTVDYICQIYGGGVTVHGDDIYIADANRNRIYWYKAQETCAGPPPPPWTSSEPKILLHVTSPTTKNQCTVGLPDCRSAVASGALSTPTGPFHFVYLLATRGPVAGLRGIQLGISYDDDQPGQEADQAGIDVFGWTLCATLNFPTVGASQWPQPGSGNLITWGSCPNTNINVAGYFYVGAYAPGVMRIRALPNDGLIKVADCNSAEMILTQGQVGLAEFGTDTRQACNPCEIVCEGAPVAVQATTWSAIKQLR